VLIKLLWFIGKKTKLKMSKSKYISLAFVTLNNPEDLIRTFLSIKNLSHIIQEIIIIDSSNNSLIREYCDSEIVKYFTLKYIWEQPKGIYHAMNSALYLAEPNNYIWYLNPGDLLVNSNVLKKLLAKIKNHDLVWGYAQAQKRLGHLLEIFPRDNVVANFENIASGRLSVSHQSMLTSVIQLKNLGGFDEKFEVAADLKVQILLSKKFVSACILLPIVEVDPSGISHNRILRTFFETFVIRFSTKGYSKFSSIFLAIKFIWSKVVNKLLKYLRIIT
jgi:hypothetical protein